MNKKKTLLWVSPQTASYTKAMAALDNKNMREFVDETIFREAEKRGLTKHRRNDNGFF